MNTIVTQLEDLERSLAEASDKTFESEVIPDLPDDEIAALLEATGRIQKRIEALQVEASVQVLERSAPMRDDKITEKYGCSRPVDLIRVLTRSETRDANRVIKTARLLTRTRGVSSGEFLPARYPELRSAVVSGTIGVAGLLAAIEPLEHSRSRILDDARIEADRQLAMLARGIADDAGADTGDGADTEASTPARSRCQKTCGCCQKCSSPTSTPTARSPPTRSAPARAASPWVVSATEQSRCAATSCPKSQGSCRCFSTAC